MKRLCIILLLVASLGLFSSVSLASVGVQDSGTRKGAAADLNFSTGLTITGTGSTKTISVTGGAGDNTLDDAYDQGGAGSGAKIEVDGGVVELEVDDTSNNGALLLDMDDSTNNPNVLTITNAGSGADISAPNFTLTNGELASTGLSAYGATANANLTIDAKGTGTITLAGTSSGKITASSNVELDEDVDLGDAAGDTVSITGSIDANVTLDDGSGASPSIILKDGSDETATFSKADTGVTSLTTEANDGLKVLTGNFWVGNGSPGTASMDGEDAYVEGQLEVDGAIQLDGALTTAAAVSITGTTPSITVGDGDAEDTQIDFNGTAQDYGIGVDDTGDDLVIGRGTSLGTTEYLTFLNDSFVITLGDASAADSGVLIDGNSDDFYVALEDASDDLVIGHGGTVGSDQLMTFADDANTITLGDATEADTMIVFDGHSGGVDWYVANDDSADDLIIGEGSAVDTTPAITISNSTQHIEIEQELNIKDALTLEAELQPSDETVTCSADAGTAGPDVTTSYIVTDGGADTNEDTVSLADGTAGEVKIFVYKTETDAGDSANVTPSNAAGFTDILFEDPGDGCIMIFDGANWSILSNNGGTIT